MYSLIFHANLQYAEIPKKDIEKVIEKSYIPTIKRLLKLEIPFGLNITGYSLNFLPKFLISLIGEGIDSGLIELTGTSYTHAVLPLLSLDRVKAQIEKDLNLKKSFFNTNINLFWLPELSYDPIIPAILKDMGYNEVFVDGESLLLSKIPNTAIKNIESPYHNLLKAHYSKHKYFNYIMGLHQLKKSFSQVFGGKVKIMGVRDITGIPVWEPLNIGVMLTVGNFPFIDERKLVRWIKNIDNVILYGSDLEFFGYRNLSERRLNFGKLIFLIKNLPDKLVLPSKLPFSGKGFYLKTSSWAPDKSLDLWRKDEDNQRLNYLSSFISNCEKSFLAENSDARGWEPIPERRLDAFKAIYECWRDKNG